ncbi:uncharacterized protein LOC128877965 [Hylaeus volcanicus]|uniref:uncharacterized protein LOC128877965 n=1 Tax=Hylaeus volcanicus TaxID=313075 RepID=UPI0023B7B046|nr:uncharacterized protein LOC128877965 [Hylaeus volcanicus]
MTTIDERQVDKRNVCIPFGKGNTRVPQQLIEAEELLNSVNRRLEDCALEWQAEISRKQWKIFNSNTIGENPFNKSLLSRTYFSEESLDEAFQHLLSCNKAFSEYLKNFIALLQGKKSILNIKDTCDAQNQCPSIPENCNALNNFNIEPMQFSLLQNSHLNETKKTQDLVDNVLIAQNLFADVIKAKVHFDTKFLGFEAIFHKTTTMPTDTNCPCNNRSKIMVNIFYITLHFVNTIIE